jgi:elongation factor G
MNVTISVGEGDLGGVVHDLSSARGGQILSLDGNQDSPSSVSAEFWGDEQVKVDPKKIYAPPDPFSTGDAGVSSIGGQHRDRQVIARVPLREMVGYLRHLRSLTGGRGTFVMQVDRFEKVSGQRLNGILKEIRGDMVGHSR